MTYRFSKGFGKATVLNYDGVPVEYDVVASYSSSVGWNPDGTLHVEENGVEVFGADAERVVRTFGVAMGWSIFEMALDPDGSKRAEAEAEDAE